jgi:acyl carrier protein
MSEMVSSRTPEGRPNRCPVCDGQVCIEPSTPPGDAPCPQCGTLLWFFDSSEGYRLFKASFVESIRSRLAAILCERLGIAPPSARDSETILNEFQAEIASDSLDSAELVMELEEEFDISVSSDEAARLKTVADVEKFVAERTGGVKGE